MSKIANKKPQSNGRQRPRRQRRGNQPVANAKQASHLRVRADMLDRGLVGTALTRLIMMPGDSQLHRMPTRGMMKTAIARSKDVTAFTETYVGDVSIGDWSTYTYVAYIIGEPSLTYMDGPWMVSGLGMTHTAQFGSSSLTSPSGLNWTIDLAGLTGVSRSPTSDFWPLVGLKHDTSMTGHQAYRPTLTHKGIHYMWINAGERIAPSPEGSYVEASGALRCQAQLYVDFECLLDDDADASFVTVAIHQFDSNVGDILFGGELEFTKSGWYCARTKELIVSEGTLKTLNVRYNLKTPSYTRVWKLHYVDELVTATDIAQQNRRTAFSYLLSNRSSALVAQGSVLAARLDPGFPNVGEGISMFNKLQSADERYTDNANKGLYTYMEFTEDCEKFEARVNNSGYPLCHFPTNMVHLVTVKNPTQSTNDYAIATDCVMEFTTQSQLFTKAVPVCMSHELEEARRISSMTAWFYENPVHWDDISRYITAAWRWASRNTGLIENAAVAAFPQYSPKIRALVGALK